MSKQPKPGTEQFRLLLLKELNKWKKSKSTKKREMVNTYEELLEKFYDLVIMPQLK